MTHTRGLMRWMLLGMLWMGTHHPLAAVESRSVDDRSDHNTHAVNYMAQELTRAEPCRSKQLLAKDLKDFRQLIHEFDLHASDGRSDCHCHHHQGIEGQSTQCQCQQCQSLCQHNRLCDFLHHQNYKIREKYLSMYNIYCEDFFRQLRLQDIHDDYTHCAHSPPTERHSAIKAIDKRMGLYTDFLFMHVAGYIATCPVDNGIFLASVLHRSTAKIKQSETYQPKHSLDATPHHCMSLILNLRALHTPKEMAMLQDILNRYFVTKPDTHYAHKCHSVASILAELVQEIACLDAKGLDPTIQAMARQVVANRAHASSCSLSDVVAMGQSLMDYIRHHYPNPQDLPASLVHKSHTVRTFHQWTKVEKERQDKILSTMLILVQCSNMQKTKPEIMVMKHYRHCFYQATSLVPAIHHTLVTYKTVLDACFEASSKRL